MITPPEVGDTSPHALLEPAKAAHGLHNNFLLACWALLALSRHVVLAGMLSAGGHRLQTTLR